MHAVSRAAVWDRSGSRWSSWGSRQTLSVWSSSFACVGRTRQGFIEFRDVNYLNYNNTFIDGCTYNPGQCGHVAATDDDDAGISVVNCSLAALTTTTTCSDRYSDYNDGDGDSSDDHYNEVPIHANDNEV